MAIFGVGAFYDGTEDVSGSFIQNNIIGVGWDMQYAPELHQFINALKVGDIVYIKSYSPSSPDIIIKAIGIITDSIIRLPSDSNDLVSCGRNVRWIDTDEFRIRKPQEKNNVRANTMYEEYHPDVQRVLIERITNRI